MTALTAPAAAARLRLPDFAVIGGSKCGTHWLNECLREHPEIYLTPDVHEIFFFDRYFDRGPEWYARYFRGYGGQLRVGDVTPTYLANPRAAKRLSELLPQATLLVCLRNPIERAWSNYLHMWRKGDIPPDYDFRTACQRAPKILTDGEFYRCLQPWLAHFPAGQLHLLIVDDAKRDAVAYLRQVYEVFGVDADFVASHTTTRTNEHQTPRSLGLARVAFGAARWLHGHGWHGGVEFGKRIGVRRLVLHDGADPQRDPSPLSMGDRRWLAAHYREDVAALSGLVGRDLVQLWLSPAMAPATPGRQRRNDGPDGKLR